MTQVLSSPQLPRWLLMQAGGTLQHARGLLCLAGGSFLNANSVSCNSSSSSSSSALALSEEHGRSISTTRGIYMGRVFIRENLQRHPAPSPLFTKDNYQFLEKNNWSVAACEQVLHNHQEARPFNGRHMVNKHLTSNIRAVESLDQLQSLVTRHAHQMNAINWTVCVQMAAQLLLKPDGTPDYQSAALVLSTIAAHLQPSLAQLSGPQICNILASFVRCRASPPADMLQEMLQHLMADGNSKLQEANSNHLAQLLLALSRLVQPQAHWPVMKAILARATELMQGQVQAGLAKQQRQQQEEEQQPEAAQSGTGTSSSSSSSSSSVIDLEEAIQEAPQASPSSSSSSGGSTRPKDTPVRVSSDIEARRLAVQRAQERAHALRLGRGMVAAVNSTALTAVLLDKANSYSPEYLRVLYHWLEDPDRLACLYPNAAVQLWSTVKSQWAKFEARTAANSASAAAAAAAAAAEHDEGSGSSSSSAAAPADSAAEGSAFDAADPADVSAASGDFSIDTSQAGSLQDYQQKLAGFFGGEALQCLADATVPLVSSMNETGLGLLFNCIGRMRYVHPELLSAMTAAYTGLLAVHVPTHITKANAAWAAAQLQHYEPALLLPALLAAVQHPEQQDGFLAARIMIATAQLPQEELQRLQQLLRQEQHRLSGARGPLPAATTAADPATAAAGQVPDWVASLADSLADRMTDLRPRETAYIMLSYSQIPDVPVHEKLFTAAAEHIAVHAHAFTKLDDMEMVATAFERFNFKAGLPALKALQQQSEQLVSSGTA